MTKEEKLWTQKKDQLNSNQWWLISRMTHLSEDFMEQNWDKLNHWDISGS